MVWCVAVCSGQAKPVIQFGK